MVIELSNSTVIAIGDDSVCTTLPGGAVVTAIPRGDAGQARTAQELGYGDDVAAMTRDHDPLHSVLADWLGMPCSAALLAAARDDSADPALAELEERAVIALQALMVAVGASPAGLATRLRAMTYCGMSKTSLGALSGDDPAICVVTPARAKSAVGASSTSSV